MVESKFEKNGGYFIGGVPYMDCKITGEPVANVSEEAVSVIGSKAVMGMVGMPDEPKQRVSTGRPAGWHFMNEFVERMVTYFIRAKNNLSCLELLNLLRLNHLRRKRNVGLNKRYLLLDKLKRR